MITHWKAQLNILWIGQAVLMAMLAMSLPYWPLYIRALGSYSPQEVRFWSMIIYLAPFVSSIFSSPLWGKIGDRYGYKQMVIRAALGLWLTQTLILFSHSVALIFIIRLLQGILAGFIVAAQAWGLSICPHNERGATMGKLQSATAVGNLFGPVLGGVIATYAGYHTIFTSSSVLCALVTLLFVFFLQNTAPLTTVSTSQEKEKPKTSLSGLHQAILAILTTIVFLQLARQMITPVFALFVTEQLKGNDMTIGILYAATGLMIFLTAPLWGKYFDKKTTQGIPAHNTIILLLLTSAVVQMLQAYVQTVSSIFVLRLIWGVCLGGLLPVLLNLLIDKKNEEQKGLFLGLGNSATKLGNLLGILVGALIEGFFGFTHSFLITAIVYLLAAAIVYAITPHRQPVAVK